MTRKDYIKLARGLREAYQRAERSYHFGTVLADGVVLAVREIARVLAADNYRFSEWKFFEYIFGEEEAKTYLDPSWTPTTAKPPAKVS